MTDAGPWRVRPLRFALMTVVTGLVAGVCGAALALLLHAVQHLAYGYATGPFLTGVQGAPPARRVLVTALAGVVAGAGWWALYRFREPLVDVAAAVRAGGPRLPLLTTCWHALLQIVTVGLGSPLGRETAPRELAAVFAAESGRRAGLTPAQGRILIACAAGGGLAAVYDVPLGGALFTLEVLIGSWAAGVVVPAAAVAALATVVSWLVLPDEPVYVLPELTVGPSLVVWSVLAGPLLGGCGYAFARLCARARRAAPRGRLLMLTAPLAFTAIGLLAIPYPALLGNGKSPAEIAFRTQPALGLTAVLLALRTLAVLLALRSGGRGGLLTPSVAGGALLGALLGGGWLLLWPGSTPGGYAVVGAAAFLAVAQQIPLTAAVLVLEFTGAPRDLVVPVLIAVAGAMAAGRLCARLPLRRDGGWVGA
ncbi:chloride channel protein [Streptomyces sp. NPDC089919]|uniref:chloride channel protein n=1 Tax=Streptomyces sp. NPDC089919 TaxID=3155188 RepID=UPI0034247975